MTADIPAVLDPHRDATLPPESSRRAVAGFTLAPLLPRVSHRHVIRVLLRAEEIRRGLERAADRLGGPTSMTVGDALWMAGDASDRVNALKPGEARREAALTAAAWAMLALEKVEAER